MKIKKIPMRSCVITKEKLPKSELVRVVRKVDNTIAIDLTGKLNGRGAYLKKDKEVFDKARKTKILEKHLECNISEDIYDELDKLI